MAGKKALGHRRRGRHPDHSIYVRLPARNFQNETGRHLLGLLGRGGKGRRNIVTARVARRSHRDIMPSYPGPEDRSGHMCRRQHQPGQSASASPLEREKTIESRGSRSMEPPGGVSPMISITSDRIAMVCLVAQARVSPRVRSASLGGSRKDRRFEPRIGSRISS